METEYPSYKLGLSPKRGSWLVEWLRGLAESGKAEARSFAQGLGRLGFASIAPDWERPFLGPLHAWSAAVQGKSGPLTLPAATDHDPGPLRLASGAAREWGATAEA